MRDSHAIIDRLASKGNPIIEVDRATICWQGDQPPLLRADFSGWEDKEPSVLAQISENLWIHEIELPSDSYIEYAFFKGKKRIKDPLNPLITPNGLGEFNNYFCMPEYRATTLHEPVKGVSQGKVFETRVPTAKLIAGRQRTVYLYQPPVKEPVPLVVVYDGGEYYYRTRLPVMIDNLLAAGRIRPVALAMIENSTRYRALEYACSEATLFHMTEYLLPFVNEKLNLIDVSTSSGAYGVIGASLGGLMAFYTALRLPHIFGSALIQSAAFSLPPYNFVVWDLIQRKPRQPQNLWLDCGRFGDFIDTDRKMARKLAQKGYHFRFNEYNGGHNYPSWRNDLPNGLEYLFGITNA